ncbi:hypothetical protein TNCV_4825711 [Trichonephila clavipes]|uniref:Uncharacterized protein n=1 Tax=Trichonephila clavipes TaxID=2585209 RepID=A0A8X6RQ68_TRICX|nr:hypothetical protein TNCV_4825711 [Trichonephila clavipes]
MIPDMLDCKSGDRAGQGGVLTMRRQSIQSLRARHHSKQRRRWVGVKGSIRNGRRDPECPSARRLRMVREDTGSLMKVIPAPGWRPIKQLAVRVHFLQCGGILDDWSVLSLVFI